MIDRETDAFLGALRELARVRRLLVALDFDGTLAHLADDPQAVAPVPSATTALRALAADDGVVLALVSGRPIAFLDEMLAPHRFDIAGLHGAQIRQGGELQRRHIFHLPVKYAHRLM